MKYRAFILILPMMALLGFLSNDVESTQQLDDADTEALFKAKYLYEFAVTSDWPRESKTGPFIVAIYGSSNLFLEMSDRYATKPVGSQKMEIIQVLNLEDLPPCQMLYMSRRTAKELPLVLKHLQGKNTMLVTHIEGPAKPGATINFVIQESKIYFEVNLKEARKRKIVIGSKLIQWAIKS